MTDHEALEALSKKATQGTIEVQMPETEHDHGVPLIATDYPGTFGPSNGLVLWATMLPTEITDKDTAQAEANAAFTAALWNAYRTGQLIPAPSVPNKVIRCSACGKPDMMMCDCSLPSRIPAPSVDDTADKIMWHVEQVMGPVSREVCENPGDDDYSVLRHNIAACLKAKEQADV